MDVPATLENGRYVLRRPLGSGGTATVFEAWDTRLGEAVAVKLLTGGDAARRSLRRRLRAETQAMRSVNHRNVLRVIDLRAEGDLDYVVMDLAPGGSLQDRLDAHGPLPVGEAVGYVEQILAALAAAHAARVVHRDVKPQNVLLDAEGVALLADFGIARVRRGEAEDGITRMGVAMGSFAYMPPEQRLDAHDVDERADVYAAGATLYALLTAGNPVDLFTAGPTSARWAGVPVPLVDVIRGATAQDRADRYPSARAFGRALAEAVATLPPDVLGAPSFPFPELTPAPRPDEAAWQSATREAVTFLRLTTPPVTPPETLVWGGAPDIDTSLGEGEPYAGPPAPGARVEPPRPVEPHVRAPTPPPARWSQGRWALGLWTALVVVVAAGTTWGWASRGGEVPDAGATVAVPDPGVAVPDPHVAAVHPAVADPVAAPADPAAAPADPVAAPADPAAAPAVAVADRVVAPAVTPAARPPAPGGTAAPEAAEAPASAVTQTAATVAEDGPFGEWYGSWMGHPARLTLRGTPASVQGSVVIEGAEAPIPDKVVGSYDEGSRVFVLADVATEDSSDLGTYRLTYFPDEPKLDGTLQGARSSVRIAFHREP